MTVVAFVLVVVVVAFVADVVAGAAAFVVVDVKAIATLYVGPVRLT